MAPRNADGITGSAAGNAAGNAAGYAAGNRGNSHQLIIPHNKNGDLL